MTMKKSVWDILNWIVPVLLITGQLLLLAPISLNIWNGMHERRELKKLVGFYQLAMTDPAAAADWAQTLEDREESKVRLYSVALIWVKSDPSAAAAWAEALQDETRKIEVLKSVAYGWVESDPSAAAAWAEALQDETGKVEVLESVARNWVKSDPSAAAAWAEALQDEETRAEVLSLLDRLNPGD